MDGQNNQQNNYQDYTSNASYQPPVNNAPSGANGCQVAGLVLGIIGIPACCCYGLGLILGVIGLILALVGNRKNRGSGIGIAGLICSIIATVFGVIMAIYFGYVFVGVYQGLYEGTGPFVDLLDQMGYDIYYFIQMHVLR
ncbi:MAG: hypothetical protein NC541_07405 [bacterium]|nr:hypothetical protein [bacterium]